MNENLENVILMQIDELTQRAKDLVTPINFDELISAGVIEKKGVWYQINKWNELPEHAKAKISTAKSGRPPLVKFRAPSKRLAKFLEDSADDS